MDRKTNFKGFLKKLKVRHWILIGILMLIIIKFCHTIYSNHVGRDLRAGSDDSYFDTLKTVKEEINPKNIVLINVDDMGHGDVSYYGSEVISTPNIDSIAQNGAALTNFYAASPICSPSRAGLLTGRYPNRTHVPTVFMHSKNFTYGLIEQGLKLTGLYSYGMAGISQDEILLSEALQALDYNTALIGKWHLGSKDGYLPNQNGFDYFYGALYSNDMYPYEIYRDDEVDIPHPFNQEILTKRLTEEAVDFIDENKDEPFFLYYASPFPHYPAVASDDFKGSSGAGTYGDCVQELDWSVGQILDKLEEEGLTEDTVVIFTSDNGPWYEGDTSGYRSRKGSNFNGGHLVPAFISIPGVIEPDTVYDGVISAMDLFPTLLSLINAPLPDDRIIDGHDLMPLFTGEEPNGYREELFLLDGKKAKAVVSGNFKYFAKSSSDMAKYATMSQGPFLFNIKTDERESYDQTDHHEELAEELSLKMDVFNKSIKENLRGWIDE